MKEVSFLIATRNRLDILKQTLEKSKFLIEDKRVQWIILDDHSRDGTSQFLKANYPKIQTIRTQRHSGILHARNLLYNAVKTPFAITLDDDINFAENYSINDIIAYFEKNSNCAVMAFRIYWGLQLPENIKSDEVTHRVKSFGAGGHAIRMEYWKKIPDLPHWFRFYGEEDFMALHFLKRGYSIDYVPRFLVHHRTDLRARKKDRDYIRRMRMSLRAGWYIYLIFYPGRYILKKLGYSLWMQLKKKVSKGNLSAGRALVLAISDMIRNLHRLLIERAPLTYREYEEFMSLPDAKLYWKPEMEKNEN